MAAGSHIENWRNQVLESRGSHEPKTALISNNVLYNIYIVNKINSITALGNITIPNDVILPDNRQLTRHNGASYTQ